MLEAQTHSRAAIKDYQLVLILSLSIYTSTTCNSGALTGNLKWHYPEDMSFVTEKGIRKSECLTQIQMIGQTLCCHTKVCYSLSWESTRSSRQQVRNEGMVWKVPIQNGWTHHFCAMCALPVLQYCNVLLADIKGIYQARLGTAGPERCYWWLLFLVSSQYLGIQNNKALPHQSISEGQEFRSSYLEGSGSGCLTNLGLSFWPRPQLFKAPRVLEPTHRACLQGMRRSLSSQLAVRRES